MQHRHCVEAVDCTLQDICDTNKSFGGITVVLGGDFRQILPVIPKGVREQIVGASLRRSLLWRDIHILILGLNMRLNNPDGSNQEFAKFLMEVFFLISINNTLFSNIFLFYFFLGREQSSRTYRTSRNNTPMLHSRRVDI